jgi:hypothetical protein
MNTVRNLFVLTGLATVLWAQPDLFFNQGALVYVQSGALLYVQGGYVNNDNAGNNGVTENYGTIRLVNAGLSWRGHLTNGTGAEFNTYSGSWVYLQGDFTNDGYYRAGMTGYGGTIEFNGTSTQNYQNTANVQAWILDTVRINNLGAANARYVNILSTTTQDMHIRSRLHFESGRIHTQGNTEVRMINSDPGAITRAGGAPSMGAWTTLATNNDDRYIYGRLRWRVDANRIYPFIVGGDPATLGIQQIDVQITNTPGSGGHYVRVRFDPTVQQPFTNATYCRPGDPTPSYTYTPLNNGRWEVMPFDNINSTTPSITYNDLAGVGMHNRVVTNATSDGFCPAAGTSPDDYWPTRPTDLCYVGYNQRSGTATSSPHLIHLLAAKAVTLASMCLVRASTATG